MDDFFTFKRLSCVEAPTGVGFCMYIKRNAIVDVGYFDEKNFGRGYGEENDFCQRAINKGFVNLITPNMYVYHKGGVSFGTDKNMLVENASRVIDKLHPNYHMDVQKFISKDPLREARLIRHIEIIGKSNLPKKLQVSHGIGGGVDQHIKELSMSLKNRAITLSLIPINDKGGTELRFGVETTADSIYFDLPMDINKLIELLKKININLIHYHHVLQVESSLIELPIVLSVPHVLTIHDFYLLAGNPTLTDEQGYYSGKYDENLVNPLYPLPAGMSLQLWRARYRKLIETAKVVIFPSYSTRFIFGNIYNIKKEVIAYHPEITRDISTVPKKFITKDRYIIAVVGAISKEKGADLLEKVALLAELKGLPFDFILIGYAYRNLKGVKTTGPYESESLPKIIENYGIDIFFFPARWPETYSYTLSYALASGLSILAPNTGAFPERLADRKNTMLFDYSLPPDEILNIIKSFVNQCENNQIPACPHSYRQPASSFFYEDEYLTYSERSHLGYDNYDVAINDFKKYSNNLSMKEAFLVYLWRIYSHKSMRFVNIIIPFSVRRSIKRKLSRNSIHDLAIRSYRKKS